MGGNDVDPGVEGRQRRKLGLSAKIFIGLLAGIGCGLFFGEYCYPQFSVVIPNDVEIGSPLVYPVASDAVDLVAFVERWSGLAEDDGTTDELYDYWILGRGVEDHGPRWSVIRDVVHWVE